MTTLSHEQTEIKKLASGKSGQIRSTCPYCSHNRHDKTEQCLSISATTDKIRYTCWHCDEAGVIDLDESPDPYPIRTRTVLPYSPPPPLPASVSTSGKLSPESLAFLEARGISDSTARRAGCYSIQKYFRKIKAEGDALAFPYKHEGVATGVKYRYTGGKDFSWDGKAAGMWGTDDTIGPRFSEPPVMIVVEGELDRLAMLEAGVRNVMSVPNGAPNKVSAKEPLPDDDKSFAFVWDCRKIFDQAEKVILATDYDLPGEALAEELARRIGKDKCWKVVYPEGCKDANDILLKLGADALLDMIDEAEPWPVAGLFLASHYKDAVEELYASGPGKGLSTGIDTLDELFTIAPGQLSVVTGLPGSGKSNVLDQVMVNMAQEHGWGFAICSFENPPAYHLVKLTELITGKPFFEGPTPRQTREEVAKATKFINKRFAFMDFADGAEATIDVILERAKAAVRRLGVRGLVVDPFNYVHLGKGNDTETNLISDMLTKLRSFAISHDCHVWFVAHPQKIRRSESGRMPIPRGYDISGSAAFFAKADIGWSAARPEMHQSSNEINPEAIPCTEVHVWKVRYKWLGKLGSVPLEYNPVTSQYTEMVVPDWGDVDDARGNRSAKAFFRDTNTDFLKEVVSKSFLD